MNPSSDFDYSTAFSRNLGWVTAGEQEILRHKCIAIAGMGGVGGHHLLSAVRAGIGRFRIADFDRFETANFNRQAGSSMSHLGESKVDVLARMALDINPQLSITTLHEGIDSSNVHAFLEGADLYLDGLDFFALEARRQIFAACYERNILAITAAPLGMGAAWLAFQPGRMSFEDYFCLADHDHLEQMIRFAIGLAPRPLQMGYLVDSSYVDLIRQRVPSTPMACNLCAGVAVTSALKILLNRGPVLAAPHSLHFDAYRNRFVHNYRPWGNKHPLQRLGLALLRRKLSSNGADKPSDLARQIEKN